MEYMVMLFIVFSIVISLFSMVIVTRDIWKEYVEARKEERRREEAANAAQQPVVVQQPVVEEPVVEEPAIVLSAEEPENMEVVEEIAPTGVQFSSSQPTLDEKYLQLSPEFRAYYDEIIKYAAQVEESKRFKNARYEEYKVGKIRLVRMLIKRGVIHCEFIMHNNDFKSYVATNKISVKHAATVMKVLDEATVQAVKDTIDIVIKTAEEEKEEKKRLALERRREKRRQTQNA